MAGPGLDTRGSRGDGPGGAGREWVRATRQVVNRIWEHVGDVDPHGERDLSPARHREVFYALMDRLPEVDDDLARALYEVMLDVRCPYGDALLTLRELRLGCRPYGASLNRCSRGGIGRGRQLRK